MTAEDLLQSLETIADEEEPTERLRKRRKKKYRKAYHEGRLHFDWRHANALDAYKLCVAEQINGRYHWVGWECRGDANWAMATRAFPLPRWDGSDCKLLVLAEQGLGDEILFASCFPDLLRIAPRAAIECDPRLKPIFERSFDARFITRWNVLGEPKTWRDYEHQPDFDMFCPAGELAKIFRKKRQDFPGGAYLKPPPRRYAWKSDLPLVGLSWKGRQGYIAPGRLMVFGEPLSKVHYADLQYGDASDKDAPMWNTGLDVTNDIDGVFAIVSSLKAVICVPNTLAHIGGSLGLRTHVVRPEAVYAGDREDEPLFHNRLRFEFGLFDGRTPWYRSVRTYRGLAEFRVKCGRL